MFTRENKERGAVCIQCGHLSLKKTVCSVFICIVYTVYINSHINYTIVLTCSLHSQLFVSHNVTSVLKTQCLVQEALPVTNGRIEFDAKTGGGAAAKKEVSFHSICMKIAVFHYIFMKGEYYYEFMQHILCLWNKR
jgi:hypothetical protein